METLNMETFQQNTIHADVQIIEQIGSILLKICEQSSLLFGWQEVSDERIGAMLTQLQREDVSVEQMLLIEKYIFKKNWSKDGQYKKTLTYNDLRPDKEELNKVLGENHVYYCDRKLIQEKIQAAYQAGQKDCYEARKQLAVNDGLRCLLEKDPEAREKLLAEPIRAMLEEKEQATKEFLATIQHFLDQQAEYLEKEQTIRSSLGKAYTTLLEYLSKECPTLPETNHERFDDLFEQHPLVQVFRALQSIVEVWNRSSEKEGQNEEYQEPESMPVNMGNPVLQGIPSHSIAHESDKFSLSRIIASSSQLYHLRKSAEAEMYAG